MKPTDDVQSTSILSHATKLRVAAMFEPGDIPLVSQILVEDCGNNLPFLEKVDSQGLERVRFAVLKLSRGDLNALQHAIDLAKQDWRDVLVTVGFGDDPTAHEVWWPTENLKIG